MKEILLAIAILFGSFLHAQNVEWIHSMGGTHRDKPVAMDIDVDGNTYVTGTFVSPTLTFSDSDIELQGSDSTDIFLYKRSPTGELLWAKVLGSEGNDHVFDLKVDVDGNAYVVGWFTKDFTLQDEVNPITFSTNVGNKKGFVAKYGPSGNLLNARETANFDIDTRYFIKLDIDLNGNPNLIIWIDESVYAPSDTTGTQLLKITPDLDYISMDKIIGWLYPPHLDFILKYTQDGGLIISAPLAEYPTAPNQRGIIKYNSEYEIEWILKQKLSSNPNHYSIIKQIVHNDETGDTYVAGDFSGKIVFNDGQYYMLMSNNASHDCFFLKFSATGTIEWLKGLGGPGYDEFEGMSLTSSGNLILTGNFSETIDVDPSLNNFNFTSSGYSSLWTAMYTPDGELIDAFSIANDNFINATDIKVGPNDEIYISGWFNTSTQFDPDLPNLILNSNGQHDVFTMKLGAITVGMNEAEANSKSVFIFPNPASETVSIHADGIREIKIFDITGKTISTIFIPHFQDGYGLSVNHLPKGLYLLQLKMENGEQVTKKLVVE